RPARRARPGSTSSARRRGRARAPARAASRPGPEHAASPRRPARRAGADDPHPRPTDRASRHEAPSVVLRPGGGPAAGRPSTTTVRPDGPQGRSAPGEPRMRYVLPAIIEIGLLVYALIDCIQTDSVVTR